MKRSAIVAGKIWDVWDVWEVWHDVGSFIRGFGSLIHGAWQILAKAEFQEGECRLACYAQVIAQCPRIFRLKDLPFPPIPTPSHYISGPRKSEVEAQFLGAITFNPYGHMELRAMNCRDFGGEDDDETHLRQRRL